MYKTSLIANLLCLKDTDTGEAFYEDVNDYSIFGDDCYEAAEAVAAERWRKWRESQGI